MRYRSIVCALIGLLAGAPAASAENRMDLRTAAFDDGKFVLIDAFGELQSSSMSLKELIESCEQIQRRLRSLEQENQRQKDRIDRLERALETLQRTVR